MAIRRDVVVVVPDLEPDARRRRLLALEEPHQVVDRLVALPLLGNADADRAEVACAHLGERRGLTFPRHNEHA